MAQVGPFRGLRYCPNTSFELRDVLCPPYDVISPASQYLIRQHSPYNAIHVELPEGISGEQYASAAQIMDQWRREGTLVRDSQPSYYILRHRFEYWGRAWERWGLTACVRLEEFHNQVIMPHEETDPGVKEDRLQLMEACKANLSPIMSLYQDPQRNIRKAMEVIMQETPTVVAQYEEDQELALWVTDSPELGVVVQDTLQHTPIFIADGHHRYETALMYRDTMRQKTKSWDSKAAFNYIMMTLIDFDDPGLLVLPYHRTLGDMPPSTLAAVCDKLQELFEVNAFTSQLPTPQALEEAVAMHREGVCLGVMGLEDDRAYILTLRAGKTKEELRALPGGAFLHDFEGWVLQEAVMEPVLGSATDTHLTYIHDPVEVWDSIIEGRQQMGFFLRSFPMDLFQALVSTGQRLPRKSTYFHPKLPTGLVFNLIDGEI
ncbi:DUF1015 domain-containing protein [Dehalococcoidia bacterium]|nr:DUF1015 domain-containing protein [Dehalococcoidia bacterium]